jgi:hypothetical protein
MNCPQCGQPMQQGKFLIRYSANFRAFFSSADTVGPQGFVENYMPASLFDKKQKPGQIEVLPERRGGHSSTSAWRCEECHLILMQEVP